MVTTEARAVVPAAGDQEMETKPQSWPVSLQDFLLDSEPSSPERTHEGEWAIVLLSGGSRHPPALGHQVGTRGHMLKHQFIGTQ